MILLSALTGLALGFEIVWFFVLLKWHRAVFQAKDNVMKWQKTVDSLFYSTLSLANRIRNHENKK